MKSKAGKRLFHFSFGIIGTLIIFMGCAKSVRPPGGPIDRTPPEVFETYPVSGSVQVPLDSRVIIRFSEAIDRNTAEKSLFISPLPDPEPKIRTKSDAIIIEPRRQFQPDKTYVVTIGTDLRDAHRVSLDQSITVAFSTGNTIDSGSIEGTVYRSGKGATGVSMALFEDEPERAGVPVDSLIPDYITQSGEGGSFAFRYLPEGAFYLAAFEDKNKNRRINPTREMIGLPFTSTTINPDIPFLKDVDVQLHKYDSSTLGLRSVSINADRLLKVRYNKPLEGHLADSLISSSILSREDDSAAISEISGFTSLSSYPASDFIILTDPLVTGASYRLSFDLHLLFPQIPDSLRMLTYTFTVPEGEDQSNPVLLESIPIDSAVNVYPDSSLLLRFSENLDSGMVAEAVRLINAEEDTNRVSFIKRDEFTYVGRPVGGMSHGRDYRLLIDAPSLSDKAGNRLSDSVVVISFTTIGRDTLGQLSGEIQFMTAEDALFPVVVSINPAGAGETRQVTVLPGQVQFMADLIPGYYTVSAFLDRNGNGQFDYGSIVPYQLAEPFTAPVDTFRVRTRFESAGVLLEL